MVEQKYIDFIEHLIKQTKEKKLHWQYLDENEKLYQAMGWTTTKIVYDFFAKGEEKIYADFNKEDSFYVKRDNVFIVIHVYGNNPADLYVVPNTYKKVVKILSHEYGEYITRLLNIVQSQFPDGEKFIDDLLKLISN